MINTLPVAFKHSAGPLLLAMICSLLFFLEPRSGDLLAFDRYAIDAYETWRLLSSSVVHTNGYHVLLNLAGLFLLWALHGELYKPVWFTKLFVWCAFGTAIGIYYYSPNMIWYAGMSGALHGMFIWGACMDIQRGMKSGWLLLIGVMIKLAHEQYAGSSESIASLIDANVAVDSHLYGALSGLLLYVLPTSIQKLQTALRSKH